MKKRILSLAMAVLMVFSLFPFTAAAADIVDSGSCGENLTWTLDADGLLTISGTGQMTDAPWDKAKVRNVVVEPGVTSVCDAAFYIYDAENYALKSVSLPDTVTRIGGQAFYDCKALGSINLPESLTEIGYSAFYGCASLKSVVIPASVTSMGDSVFSGCTSLSSLTIGSGVTYIPGYAFDRCSSLTSVNIPEGVTRIDYNAFSNCGNLVSVNIPEGVTSIANGTFEACHSLVSMEIPYGVTSIGYNAFSNCHNLESVEIPASVTSIGGNAFSYCEKLKHVEIPDGVQGISNGMFYDCRSLETAELGSGVISIGENAFANCVRLESMTIPDSVTNINQYAFQYCYALRNVEFGSGLERIGSSAFYGCRSLESLVIPDSVTSIEGHAFCECGALRSVKLGSGVTSVGWNAFQNSYALESVEIGLGVQSILQNAFSGCTSLTTADYAGTQAQWDEIYIAEGNENLTNALVLSGEPGAGGVSWFFGEDGVLTIRGFGRMEDYSADSDPFYGGQTVRQVVIEPGVTHIGSFAFRDCAELESVTIPTTVATVGRGAFSGCAGLKDVHYAGTGPEWRALRIGLLNAPLRNADVHVTPRVETSGKCGSGVAWTLDSEGLLTVSGAGDMESAPWNKEQICSVVIEPGVTSICDDAFAYCYQLTSVTIPDTVTRIGSYAFRDCHALESVDIPNGVTSLGDGAFYYCSSMKSASIPGSVEHIPYNSFSECHELKRLTIENGVKSIGSFAFNDNRSLNDVEIPDSVTSIDYEAFHGCSSLTDISIPASVANIQANAFDDCPGLTDENGFIVAGGVLVRYSGYGGNIVIPDGVQRITAGAFQQNSKLTGVTIPDSVTAIDPSAFAGCTKLVNASLGSSVECIADSVFSGCGSLERIAIPASVASIGNSAFRECRSLERITIPDGAAQIGSGAFADCDHLKTVELGSGVASIGSSAFSGCTSLESIAIPDSVTTIEFYAFSDCSSLVSVSFGSGVKSIGYRAFNNCTSLESVKIPDGVTEINEYTFYGCTSLASVEIPGSVTHIAHYAFEDCSGLTSALFTGTWEEWQKLNVEYEYYWGEDSYLVDLLFPASGPLGDEVTWSYDGAGNFTISGTGDMWDEHPLSNKNPVRSVVIESGVTSIQDYAFSDCYQLTSVVIPNSVLRIGESAFQSCSSMTSAKMSNRVKTIGRYAFSNCSKLTNLAIPDSVMTLGEGALQNCSSLKSVTISDRLTHLTSGVLSGCSSLISVVIPDSITSIGESAFARCTSLVSVEIPDSVTDIGSYVFSDCTSLPTVEIPDSITVIPYHAFSGCTALEHMELPDSVTSIEEGAFRNCSALTSMVIPGGVTGVQGYVFSGCTRLERVTIPSGVDWIGYAAFENCTNLQGVVIPSRVYRISECAFRNCRSLTSIRIPANAELDNNAFQNCTALETADGLQGKSIPEACFSGCTSLTSVNVGSVAKDGFSGCTSLITATVSGSIAENAFLGCTALEYVSMTGGEEISSYGLSECASLRWVKLPTSIHTVVANAFRDSDALTDVYYDGTSDEWNAITIRNSGNTSFKNATLHLVEPNHTQHVWSTWIVVTAPTETEEGAQMRVCTVCGETENRVTPKLDYILSSPEDVFGYEDEETALSVVTQGEDLAYRWQFSIDNGETWTDAGSADSTILLKFHQSDGLRLYRCVVTDSFGSSIASAPARVKAIVPLAITQQPQNYVGRADVDTVFSVAAEGDGVTYQWQYKDPNGKWENTECRDSSIACRITAELDGRIYRCVLRDDYGNMLISGAASITVKAAPVITRQPQDFTGKLGVTAVFSVAATGDGLTYQWQFLEPGSTWKNASSRQASTTCKITVDRDGRQYRCLIRDAYGSEVYSESAQIIADVTPLAITQQPQDSVGLPDETAVFEVQATGDNLLYQWQYKDPGGAWTNSSFKTPTMSCKLTMSRHGRQYRCVITDAWGNNLTSAAATITVNVTLAITQQPQDVVGRVDTTATFTVAAEGEGLTYRWQYKDVGGVWTNSSFKTPTMTCKLTAARDGRQYRCVVTDAWENRVYSDPATITVKLPPVITQQPQDFTGKVGETATFTVTAEGEGLTYRWQYKDVGGVWANSSFKTATMSCKLTAARNGRQYRCLITDAWENKVYSGPATITVKLPPVITQQPQDFTGAVGQTAAFSVSVEGEGLTYQWQYKDVGGTWKNSSFQTASMSCKLTMARDGRQYRCVITDAWENKVTSSPATIHVLG